VEILELRWFAGILEFVGPFFIGLGLFTRPVAFLLSGEMACAGWEDFGGGREGLDFEDGGTEHDAD